MSQKVCVVGGGVIGLTTALVLRQLGCEVRVFDYPQRYPPTSRVAAAFWYPYAVNFDTSAAERAVAEPTLGWLIRAAADPNSGVHCPPGVEYFDNSVGPAELQRPWWADDERLEFAECGRAELPALSEADQSVLGPITRGWAFRVPVVHTPTYMDWLRGLLLAAGCAVENREVTDLAGADLRADFEAVINCPGGWATLLCDDPHLMAVRGVVVHVPREVYAPDRLVFVERGRALHRPIYMVPHPGRPTVLGGTLDGAGASGERWDPDDQSQWVADPDAVARVVRRCGRIDPRLTGLADRPDQFTALAGLRPRREARPPRIERDPRLSDTAGRFTVVHNYGHGGAGITLSTGSAERVADILGVR